MLSQHGILSRSRTKKIQKDADRKCKHIFDLQNQPVAERLSCSAHVLLINCERIQCAIFGLFTVLISILVKAEVSFLMLRCVPFVSPFLAETFDPKKFFEMVGLTAMTAENVKKVFKVLDVDGSGFIEEEELK